MATTNNNQDAGRSGSKPSTKEDPKQAPTKGQTGTANQGKAGSESDRKSSDRK